MKNCPLLKEEQEQEQFQKQGIKLIEISSANRSANSSARRLSRAMLTAWGDSTEDDEGTEKEDAALALMTISDSDSDDEPLDSLAQLKDKVRGLNKSKLEGLLFTLMDERDSINSENDIIKDACTELKGISES